MAYRLRRSDGSVAEGVRRSAGEQLDKALAEIDDRGLERGAVVHLVRRRCKKLCGVLRLVRPALPGCAVEISALREAAQLLSPFRDRQVSLECYQALVTAHGDRIDRSSLAPIRESLTLNVERSGRSDDLGGRLADVRLNLIDIRQRVAGWQLDKDGFDAMAGGLGRTLQRARKTMTAAYQSRDADAFHGWRKRVKDHWYHTRLLQPIWPEPMLAHRNVAARLSELLGAHHDLALLRQAIFETPAASGKPAETLIGLIDRRQAEIEADALPIGERLLAEPPRVVVTSWRHLYTIWRDEKKNRRRSLAA